MIYRHQERFWSPVEIRKRERFYAIVEGRTNMYIREYYPERFETTENLHEALNLVTFQQAEKILDKIKCGCYIVEVDIQTRITAV